VPNAGINIFRRNGNVFHGTSTGSEEHPAMITTRDPIRLHRFRLSGHSHRVELFLSLLGLPVDAVDVDLAAGAQKSPVFLAKNPFGQVPVIEDGDLVLADSNAILTYLALRYDPARHWYPDEPAAASRVQRWLSVAAGELASGPAAARVAALFKVPLDHARAAGIANRLFAVVDRELAGRSFLAAEHATIADIALYSYTAHAPEGGVPLGPYPQLRAWLERVEALSGFVPMPRTPIPANV
jgi:glutathione S-transferase